MRGPSAKPKSKALGALVAPAAAAEQRRDAGCMRPARMRFRPCATRRRLLASSLTTSATVPQRHQVEQRVQPRLMAASKRRARAARRAWPAARRTSRADAGQRLAGEGAARLVRVDDDVGRRQPACPRVDAGRWWSVTAPQAAQASMRHALCWRCRCPPSPARSALLRSEVDDGRRQAVAVQARSGTTARRAARAAQQAAGRGW